jgi:fermentation-respiration switch protein FrsA (DUF1100 family)
MLHPKPRVEDNSLDNMPLPAEDLSFLSRDGTRLSGWFVPATGPGPTPAVLLSHGWARSRCELLPHARFLHRAGFAVLLFDYRHRGESDGAAITMGLREQDDLLGALDVLATRPEVDSQRIGALGMSLGGAVATLVAARDERIRALTIEAPFDVFETLMVRGIRHYGKLPAFPFSPLSKWLLERRLGGALDGVAPARAIPSISPRPVFVIADANDALIGADASTRVFESAAEPKRFWLIDGAEHARGWQTAPEEYERRVLDFFQGALAEKQAVGTEAAL